MQDELQEIVERMIAAGESEANIATVIQNFTPSEPEQPQHPYAVVGRGLMNYVKNNPGASGAMAAGLASAPFTGGMSLLGAMLTGGTAAAGGSLVGRGISNAATGREPDAAADLTEAGIQGAAGAVAPVAGAGLQMLGRGLYRAGVLPLVGQSAKYGNIAKTGVENRVLATQGGIDKAKRLKEEAMRVKQAAVNEAGNRASFSPRGIADQASRQMAGKVEALKEAGEVPADFAFDTPMTRFAQYHAPKPPIAGGGGGLTPSKLDNIKGTWDDRLGDAYVKLRKKVPLDMDEEARMALSQTASRAEESVVPGYRAMNKDTMDKAGLEAALRRRLLGGGTNQGLENAATAAAMSVAGPGALGARVAMLPPVMTGMGIAANEAGKATSSKGSLVLQALLSLLENKNDQ